MGSLFSLLDNQPVMIPENQEVDQPVMIPENQEMDQPVIHQQEMDPMDNNYILHLLNQVRKKKFEFLSFQAFKIRVLIDWVLPFFQLTLQDLYVLKEKIYIHPECSEAIQQLLAETILSPKDQMILKYILSQDYHDPEIVKEFSQLLNRIVSSKEMEPSRSMQIQHALDQIFAIDRLSTYENYSHHLKYPLKTIPKDVLGIHVYAVRQLYDSTTTITPLDVFHTIKKFYEEQEQDELTLRYSQHVEPKKEAIREQVWKGGYMQ